MYNKFIHKISANEYLCFLFKLLFFLMVVFTLDFIIGSTLRYYYFKQEVGRLYRATYSIDKTNDQVLIFGSSRAYHHYIPSMIEEKLHLSCYNMGCPGQYIIYNYAILKAVLKRHTPEIIILDIMPGELIKEKNSYDRLSFLLPYYKDHPEIRSIIHLRGPFEKYKLYSAIYPFNSSFLMIAGGNLNYFKKKKEDEKGFVALTNTWHYPIKIDQSKNYELDTVKVNMLESFISLCKESNVKLFIGCSPSYVKYEKTEYTIQVIKELSKIKQVIFFDYSNDSLYVNDNSLFDDPGHLNKKGATKFTESICKKIFSEH